VFCCTVEWHNPAVQKVALERDGLSGKPTDNLAHFHHSCAVRLLKLDAGADAEEGLVHRVARPKR